MKHIEQILPEYAADDLSRLLVSDADATASAALTALLHSVTGCAIPPLATIPESEVEELVPLCLSILRRHWTTPLTALGDGTTPMSLADLMRRLILGRVDGNEALGIPPANANIPTAVSQLLQRKIGGVPEAIDGISVLNLLSNGSNIKVYDDSDQAYPLKDGVVNTLLSLLPIETLTLGMRTASGNYCVVGNASTANTTLKGTVNFANLEEYGRPTADSTNGLIKYCPNVDTVLAEKLHSIKHYARAEGYWTYAVIGGMAGLKCIKFGDFDEYSGTWTGGGNFIINCPILIDLRFKSLSCSLNLKYWLAETNPLPLSTSDNSLVPEGSTAQNNLEQFLQNFRTYIAQRLTDKGSGLTLTLSQAVRDAIQQDPEIVSIITSKGWTISPAPSV